MYDTVMTNKMFTRLKKIRCQTQLEFEWIIMEILTC